MLFSAAYNVVAADNVSWLDPVLTVDTPLFIDPFLLEDCDEPELQGSFQQVFDHFRLLFVQLAGNPNAQILDYLSFPEVVETGLGYTGEGTRGSGTGGHFAVLMRDAMQVAIRAGLDAPRHFEEIGLLSAGIGPDRISDITTRIVLPRLAAYTARVCREYNIPIQPFRLWSYSAQGDRIRHLVAEYELPANLRSDEGRCVLLVPKFILRELPTINRHAFRDYLWDVHAEELRRQFNVETKRDLTARVLTAANQHPGWVRGYVKYEEELGPRPYLFAHDPAGVIKPYRAGFEWGYQIQGPYPAPQTAQGVMDFVEFLTQHYKQFIEQRGWELLWNPTRTKHLSEKAAQRLFQGMARAVCELAGVRMSPESNAGNGPVDFSFSTNYRAIVLVELKHIGNSRYWHGPAAQLRTYLRDHDARNAMFIALGYTDDEVQSERFTGLLSATRSAARETGFNVASQTVDARVSNIPASRR